MRRTPSGGSARTRLEPALESLVGKSLGLVLGSNLEQRIDPGLDRPLAEKIAAEGVDRADARELEFLERASSRSRCSRRCFRSGPLDLAAEAQLHLAGGLLGEGDRDDAVERADARADQRDDAADQRGGLAGSGRRLDEEARAELGQDPAARLGIGKIGHGDARSVRSGSRRSLRLPRRAPLLVGTANDPIVAEVAFALVRRRGQKGVGRLPRRWFRRPGRPRRAPVIERHDLLGKAARDVQK